MIRRIEEDCNANGDDLSRSSPSTSNVYVYPYVSIGCVMFPVFVLVWYQYSKRKFCSRFGNGTIVNDDDDYSIYSRSNNNFDGDFEFELMGRHHRNDAEEVLSSRFVKWINRKNVFASTTASTTTEVGTKEDVVYQFETKIQETLSGSCCIDAESDGDPNNTNNSNNNPIVIDNKTTNSNDCFFCEDFESGIGVGGGAGVDHIDDDDSIHIWECISHIQDGGPFDELCSTTNQQHANLQNSMRDGETNANDSDFVAPID